MAVAGKGDSRRPLLTTREEFYLRDELWRCKDKTRKQEIIEILKEINQERSSSCKGLQTDL